MSLSIRQLKYFVAVAEMGRISQAAVELNISQSAVTVAIRELEATLGMSLLDRHSSGVELTDSGRRFLAHAYAVLSAVDDALHMPAAADAVEGRISLAATYTVIGYFLPAHLRRFEQLHPGIRVDLFEMNREAIEEGIVTNRYDLGVVLTSNLANPQIQTETWFGSARRLWVCANHPLLAKTEVSLADVAPEPYIMLTVDEAAYTALRYWNRTPYQPSIRLRTSSVEAVRSMVANGSGVAILSDMVYRPWSLEGKRIETINLADRIPAMDVGLAWKRNAEPTPAVRALREYFRHLYLEPSLGGAGRAR